MVMDSFGFIIYFLLSSYKLLKVLVLRLFGELLDDLRLFIKNKVIFGLNEFVNQCLDETALFSSSNEAVFS
jgi:hypothetical protein